jgi:hypothetical protein
MWKKLSALLSSQSRLSISGTVAQSQPSCPLTFRDMVSRKRKILYNELKQLAQEHTEDSFRDFVGYPFLIGSAVLEGELASRASSARPSPRRKTMLFRPFELLAGLRSHEAGLNSVQNVVFPLATWGEGGTVQVREYTIGSDAENDIVIPGFSVSARHAVIRYRNGRYLLFDVGSTNGTAVNGVRIESPGRELRDGDKVHFSRYEFAFLAPESLYRKFNRGL